MRRPGDTLPIYIDPSTCTNLEGIATLREHIQTVGDLELWFVEFDDSENYFHRWIKKEENGKE